MQTRLVAVTETGNRCGEGHPIRPVLTDEDIELIRNLREADPTFWKYKTLAEKFDVSKSCIAMIIRFERRSCTPARWKAVPVRCAS